MCATITHTTFLKSGKTLDMLNFPSKPSNNLLNWFIIALVNIGQIYNFHLENTDVHDPLNETDW